MFLHFDNKVDMSYTTFVACVIKLTFRDHIVCLFMVVITLLLSTISNLFYQTWWHLFLVSTCTFDLMWYPFSTLLCYVSWETTVTLVESGIKHLQTRKQIIVKTHVHVYYFNSLVLYNIKGGSWHINTLFKRMRWQVYVSK